MQNITEHGEAEIAASLVARIRAGDAEAEHTLVERYRRGIHYQLRKMTTNHALCEDLSQDTLCLVLEKVRAGEVREPRHLSSYIRNTARNVYIADYRKKNRRGELGHPVPGDDLVDKSPDPQANAERAQVAGLVHAVIEQMSTERDRLILYRFYVLQEDKTSVCSYLQIDPELFNRVLYRARRRFKELWLAREKSANLPSHLGVVLLFSTLCHYLIRGLR